MAAALQKHGRKGDTILAHINAQEAALLDRITDGGSVNPKTGLPEFFGSEYGGGDRGGRDLDLSDLNDFSFASSTYGEPKGYTQSGNSEEDFSYGTLDPGPSGPQDGGREDRFQTAFDRLDLLAKTGALNEDQRTDYKGANGMGYNSRKDLNDTPQSTFGDYVGFGTQRLGELAKEIGPDVLGALGGIAGFAFGGPAGAMALGGLGKYAGGASPQNAIASGIFGGIPGVNPLAQLASGYIAGEAADKVAGYAGGLPTNPDRPAPGTAPISGQQFADDQGGGGSGSPSVATSNNFGILSAPTPSSSGASGAGFTPTSGPFSVPGFTSGGVLGKREKAFGLAQLMTQMKKFGSPYGGV